MGVLPKTRTLVREDFPGQEDWIDRLLQPLNNFMSDVVSLNNRNLTFSQNFDAQLKSLQLTIPPNTVSLQNSWTAVSGLPPSFWKTANGCVVLAGAVTGGTIGSPIFTLPAGFRPATQSNFLWNVGGTAYHLRINIDGSVTPVSGNNALAGYLDGIQFYTTGQEAPWPFAYKSTLSNKAAGLVITQAANTTTSSSVQAGALSCDWQDSGNGTIIIKRITGLSPGATYNLSILTFSG